MSIPTRKIGQAAVSEIGFGAMGISSFYGAVESDEERFKVCHPEHQHGAEPNQSILYRFWTPHMREGATTGILRTYMVIPKSSLGNGARHLSHV